MPTYLNCKYIEGCNERQGSSVRELNQELLSNSNEKEQGGGDVFSGNSERENVQVDNQFKEKPNVLRHKCTTEEKMVSFIR